MSKPLFNIVFYGIIQPDKERDTVIENMATLFKTEPAKLAPYFTGGRKVIKSNVGEVVAEKYRVSLENIGLVIKIEEAEPAPADAAENTAPVSAESTANTGAGAVQTDEIEQIDTSGITMAEVGADVIENPVEVAPQPIDDISDITMAEVGADVIENPVEVTPQPIDDISDITIAEVGADIIENPKAEETPPEPDISEISMAEVGADIIEHPREKEPAPEPDISELSLE